VNHALEATFCPPIFHKPACSGIGVHRELPAYLDTIPEVASNRKDWGATWIALIHGD
jgi:hypothetical protein